MSIIFTLIIVFFTALAIGIVIGLSFNHASMGEYIEVQEAWRAAGGNPGIVATKEELKDALKSMNEAVDMPKVPDSVLNFMSHLEYLMDQGVIAEEAINYEIWNAVTTDVYLERNREIFVGF